MLFLRRLIVLLLAATSLAQAQPALTTIQDILYRADGTRFGGTMFITWSSFLAGDTSDIATANLTFPSSTESCASSLSPPPQPPPARNTTSPIRAAA